MENQKCATPIPPDEHVRNRMVGQLRAGTAPEMLLRRELHARGLRYRVGYRVPGLPRRTIDIAFTRAKVAVFVDGCFWHRCPEHFVPVNRNTDWWASKLRANVERDRDTDRVLSDLGWSVVRVWEHEDLPAAAKAVERALRRR